QLRRRQESGTAGIRDAAGYGDAAPREVPDWYDHASVPVASSIAKISPLKASPKTSPSVASNGRSGLTSPPTPRSTTHRVSPVVASNAYSWSLDCPANAAYRTPLSNDGVPV